MINRTLDPDFLNGVINHPDVRPWVAGEGVIDVSEIVSNPVNYALVTDGGGFIFVHQEPGIYEAHSQFLPTHRGSHVLRAMRAALDYMFTRTDCERVITQVPDNNIAAQGLARLGRFRTMFRRENTPRGPTAFVGLSIEDWAQETASLETDGEWFHSAMAKAVKAVKPELEDHPDDKAHDRAVGATVRMIKAGNVEKGIRLYNRWARFAGYTPASIISRCPPVINVSEAGLLCVVGLHEQDLEVLLCRSV